MRRLTSRRGLVVTLALAAPLMLSSSSSVGAGGALASQGSETAGAVCQAEPAAGLSVQLSVQEEGVRLRNGRERTGGRPEVVVLNGRGYNYGPPPQQLIDQIPLELVRARAALGQ